MDVVVAEGVVAVCDGGELVKIQVMMVTLHDLRMRFKRHRRKIKEENIGGLTWSKNVNN